MKLLLGGLPPVFCSTRWWSAYKVFAWFVAPHPTSTTGICRAEVFVRAVLLVGQGGARGVADLPEAASNAGLALASATKFRDMLTFMAGLVDVMYPVVTTTYIVEGDRSASFECLTYLEQLHTHFSALTTHGRRPDAEILLAATQLCPNLTKMARHVVKAHPVAEQIALADAAVLRTLRALQPAADYFFEKIWNLGLVPKTSQSFHSTMDVIRALSLFSPNRIVNQHADDTLNVVCPLLNGIEISKVDVFALAAQWEDYVSFCKQFVEQNKVDNGATRVPHDLFEKFWDELRDSGRCDAWVAAERIAVTYTVTSAAAERAFSLLRLILISRRHSMLRGLLQTQMMAMYNNRDTEGRHGMPQV